MLFSWAYCCFVLLLCISKFHSSVSEVPKKVTIDLLNGPHTNLVALGGEIVFECAKQDDCSQIADSQCRYPIEGVSAKSYNDCDTISTTDYFQTCPKDGSLTLDVNRNEYSNGTKLYFISTEFNDNLCAKYGAKAAFEVFDYDCNPGKDCPAPPQCQVATCQFGTCDTVDKAKGTACDDKDYLTSDDYCLSGECVGLREYNITLYVENDGFNIAFISLVRKSVFELIENINDELEAGKKLSESDMKYAVINSSFTQFDMTVMARGLPDGDRLSSIETVLNDTVGKTAKALDIDLKIVGYTVEIEEASTTQTTTGTTSQTSTPTSSLSTTPTTTVTTTPTSTPTTTQGEVTRTRTSSVTTTTSSSSTKTPEVLTNSVGKAVTDTLGNRVLVTSTTSSITSQTTVSVTKTLTSTAAAPGSNPAGSTSDSNAVLGLPLFGVIGIGAAIVLLVIIFFVWRCCCRRKELPLPKPVTYENPNYDTATTLTLNPTASQAPGLDVPDTSA
eukprot:m.20920 g.20920  ORF g.20920 m.20920 type:complete len:502 (+) comp6994_c0_seq2:141-1646(+)